MALILYVEDNDDNVYMLKARLERRGHVIAVAGDGQAGIDAVRRDQPALVIMDLDLPVLDGWEATRLLKADPATATVPILALSAHALVGAREKAIAAGADDFDTKPVRFERLVGKIDALLGRTGKG
ncbi:MAG: response regulator [Alphaproteobacteria bacterium]|nr:response regulator [Alphaproteobacteria bacterium]